MHASATRTCSSEHSPRGGQRVTLPCMTIGSEVRRRRQALGMTLDGLAERSGLSPHYLSTLENDRRDPHLSTLIAVAKGLRVPPAELLGGSAAPHAKPEVGALYERAPV